MSVEVRVYVSKPSPAYFAAGVLFVTWIVSLATGGFVLYLNSIAVGLVSTPLLGLAGLFLILVSLLYAFYRIGLILYRGLSGWHTMLAGVIVATLFYTAFYALSSIRISLALGSILAAASAAVYLGLSYGLNVERVPGRLPLVQKLAKTKRVFRILLLATVPALALLAFVAVYSPIASGRLVEVVELEKPIDVNGLKRFIPLMAAYTYASDRIQVPTHRVYPSDSYVYYLGNHSVYNWLIEPEGFWNKLTKKPLGAVFVYGDKYPPDVELVWRSVEWGLHNLRFNLVYVDSLERRVVLAAGLGKKPLLEDNMQILYRGEVLTLIPLETYKRGLLTSIRILYGYAVVHPDGYVELVRTEEALSDERFKNVPLLPEVIARSWAELRRYAVGFVQYYFYHNTYVIRDVGTNPQPYLVQDSSGELYWVIVAEPPGETYSAKYIIYIEASTTKPRMLFYELPRPVIGVSKVSSYVKQAHPVYDWGELSIEEPIPAIINGTLYWKVTILTKDYRGLVSVDLVNAETTQVHSLMPRGSISYLDTVKYILGLKPKPTHSKSIEERIKAIEEELNAIVKAVEEIRKELEELKEALKENTTT